MAQCALSRCLWILNTAQTTLFIVSEEDKSYHSLVTSSDTITTCKDIVEGSRAVVSPSATMSGSRAITGKSPHMWHIGKARKRERSISTGKHSPSRICSNF